MLVGSFIAAQHIFGDGGQLLRPGREEIPHDPGQKLGELDFQHQLAGSSTGRVGSVGSKMSSCPRRPGRHVERDPHGAGI